MKKSNTVFIAFGSNKGNEIHNINTALKQAEKFCEIKQISPLFITKPEGYLSQKDFTNGVFEAQTALTPQELLKALKQIEKILGRKETFRNAPREIDLDIIFYGDIILQEPGLIIPHKSFSQREFVLAPLAQIAPDFKDPVTGKSIKQLLSQLRQTKAQSTVKQI